MMVCKSVKDGYVGYLSDFMDIYVINKYIRKYTVYIILICVLHIIILYYMILNCYIISYYMISYYVILYHIISYYIRLE